MNPPRAGSIPVVRPSINGPFVTETQDKVNQMKLRKLPPVPNYGKNLVQELSQSKNRSSPNPESPVQDHGLSQN